MSIAVALPRFNDLGGSVSPTFLPETDLVHNYLHIVQNEQKLHVGS